MSLDHRAMNALIEGYRGNRLLRLKDYEDLFNPEIDVRHCWLCNLTFDTLSLYKKHLKSLKHIDTLTQHSSASSTPRRGMIADVECGVTNRLASLSINERRSNRETLVINPIYPHDHSLTRFCRFGRTSTT